MNLSNANRARMLREARALVTRVAFSLDVQGTKCSACPATHYRNLDEFRAHQKLSSVEGKLQQQAEDFERKAMRDIQDGKHVEIPEAPKEPERNVAQGHRSAAADVGDTLPQGQDTCAGCGKEVVVRSHKVFDESGALHTCGGFLGGTDGARS